MIGKVRLFGIAVTFNKCPAFLVVYVGSRGGFNVWDLLVYGGGS